MNANLFNRKTLVSGALIALAFGLNAQVKSTQTDEKYANTTVVYKDKASADQDVLNALGNEYGMGDVIRVTVAPPKPAAAPLIDKSKGEDVWLASGKKMPAPTLSAANGTGIQTLLAKPDAPKAPLVSPAPVAAPVVEAEDTPQSNTAIAAAPAAMAKTKSVGTTKSGKAFTKATKKSGKGYGKTKNRKKGKQRYGCPKF